MRKDVAMIGFYVAILLGVLLSAVALMGAGVAALTGNLGDGVLMPLVGLLMVGAGGLYAFEVLGWLAKSGVAPAPVAARVLALDRQLQGKARVVAQMLMAGHVGLTRTVEGLGAVVAILLALALAGVVLWGAYAIGAVWFGPVGGVAAVVAVLALDFAARRGRA